MSAYLPHNKSLNTCENETNCVLIDCGDRGTPPSIAMGPSCNLPKVRFFHILKAMDVHLTPDQKAFARRAIESGRLHSEQDAAQESLALWEERERQRTEFLLTLDDARASLSRGEGRVITQDSMRQLAQE